MLDLFAHYPWMERYAEQQLRSHPNGKQALTKNSNDCTDQWLIICTCREDYAWKVNELAKTGFKALLK